MRRRKNCRGNGTEKGEKIHLKKLNYYDILEDENAKKINNGVNC